MLSSSGHLLREKRSFEAPKRPENHSPGYKILYVCIVVWLVDIAQRQGREWDVPAVEVRIEARDGRVRLEFLPQRQDDQYGRDCPGDHAGQPH